MTLGLFQNCDVPEEVSVTFDPDDDAVVGSHYEQLYSVRTNLRTHFKGYTGLLKFLIISIELMYFVMLSNTFRRGTCKHESKRIL